MNAKFSFLSLLLLVLFSTQISLANPNESAAILARKAVSEDTAEANAAIEELRARGPEGLDALMAQYADQIDIHIKGPNIAATPEWDRLTRALDQVGQQKNNFISGLYWYTDLEEAKKAARESGKPILSLRLLGNLTDELSCANSRFFRTVLYPNAQIRDILRNRFVLHWKSVRPVPRVTVDFGDGRKLERTITGNSIHYILDSDGRLVEALPGLFGPAAFQRWLAGAETLLQSLAGKNDRERDLSLGKFYTDRIDQISRAWQADTKPLGGKLPREFRTPEGQNASAIAGLTVTKMVTERSLARAITTVREGTGRLTDEEAWKVVARQHEADWRLDERSLSLIKRQNPSLSNNDLYLMIQRFQESVGVDTVRNEYLMRSTLYAWMGPGHVREDLERFNESVYTSLFRTPSSDRWLGLVSPDIYTAIEDK
jgi:hypothetical protein